MAVLDASTMPIVLADGRCRGAGSRDPGQVALRRFAVGTALALLVVVLTAMLLARHVAEREAEADVQRATELLGVTIIENNLEDSLLNGDAKAQARVDGVVHRRLLPNTDLRRVKLWTPDGRIVYSDEAQAIGTRFPLSKSQRDTLRTGGSHAKVSAVDGAENVTEQALGSRLLEVYSDVRTPSGQPLLLEAYYSYDVAASRRNELLSAFLSVGAIALVCFLLIQASVGGMALRWLRQQLRRLQIEAAGSADRERTRIADGLHNGLLQDLVGASYAVSTAAVRAEREERVDLAKALEPAADSIRSSVQGLRSMIVDLYPSSVRKAGLEVALQDLLAPARARGVEVSLALCSDLVVPQTTTEVLYSCAATACRDALVHAQPRRLWLNVQRRGADVVLVVGNDGAGFAARSATGKRDGLGDLAEAVERAGGVLELTTLPDEGTVLTVSLPVERHRSHAIWNRLRGPRAEDDSPVVPVQTAGARRH